MNQVYPLGDLAREMEERYVQYLERPDALPLHLLTIPCETEIRTGPVERNFHGLIVNIPTMTVTNVYKVESMPAAGEWHKLTASIFGDALNRMLQWAPTTNDTRMQLEYSFPLLCIDERATSNAQQAIALANKAKADLIENRRVLMACLSQPTPAAGINDVRTVMETHYDEDGAMHTSYKVIESGKIELNRHYNYRNSILHKLNDCERAMHNVQQRIDRINHSMPTTEITQASDNFYELVLNPVEDVVNTWLGDAFGEKDNANWLTWSVKAVGRDVSLEEGEDYRIIDWNNRMRTGVWSREEKSHLFDV